MDSSDLTCKKCNQVLKNLEHNKCMYCGTPIPEEWRLEETEAERLRNEKLQSLGENTEWGLSKKKSAKKDWGADFSVGILGPDDNSGGDIG